MNSTASRCSAAAGLGYALANVTARAGPSVTLWEHDAGNAEQLATKRESRFLPGVKLEKRIVVTRDLG